jgi:adenylate kinase
MKAILLLGAPGAGKGTVASTIVKERGYEHFSTGDMLRESVRKNDEVGRFAKSFMERGELVPDDVIEKIVTARIDRGDPDAKYLFDGFPRTEHQAESFDKILAARGAKVDAVVALDVPFDVIIKRMSGRRSCKGCGAVYNLHTLKSKVDGVCDRCGGPLFQRADDEESTVRNRLSVYARQTEPLVSFYENKGLLRRVSAVDRAIADKALLAVVDEVA